jgi:hypothetical protein
MNRTGITHAFAGAVAMGLAAVAFFAALPARGLTINDNGACSAWSWDAPTSTLTCSPAAGGPPVCTVTGASAGLVNGTVTLTASCTPGATGWVWTTSGTCSNGTTSQTCVATSAATGSVDYKVRGSNTNGDGADSAAHAVNWSNTPPPAPPTGCTLTPSPSNLPAGGGLVNLTMSCGGGAPTSYAWSAPGVTFTGGATTTTNTNSATITATTAFTATASNAGGDAAATTSVQVGGGGPSISCTEQGFSKTLVVPWDWGGSLGGFDTYLPAYGGMGTNGIVVVPFTPTPPADVNNVTRIAATPYPGGQVNARITVAISDTPCDLTPPSPGSSSGIDSVTVSYGVGTVPLQFGVPSAVALTPGVQYYINVAWRTKVKGMSDLQNTCVPGPNYPNCNLRVTLSKPSGH